ncbi:unnamed protein product, partial [Mesorhabditis belari]|uniref:Peptidase A2 domain-containing protein n=1 Tax=Mesorhabditis belari TaxID=2138241 RepID=A0AAF3FII0_9BILA
MKLSLEINKRSAQEIELDEDSKLDAALLECLKQNEKGNGESLSLHTVHLNKTPIEHMKFADKTLKELGIVENSTLSIDFLDVETLLQLSNNKMTNLCRSIKWTRRRREKQRELEDSRAAFVAYQTFRKLNAEVRAKNPHLDTTFKKHPNDFGAFYLVLRECRKRKHELTPAEKVELIEETKRIRVLDENITRALEVFPESFFKIGMLYIIVKINGHQMNCFVDTGAQMSIMRESVAQRTGLMHLIDSRFQMHAAGVGGKSKALGKINHCLLTVQEVELPVSFIVLPEGSVNEPVILGLDVMVRHQVKIDLGARKMIFGQTITTEFLHPDEAAKLNLFNEAATR